MSDFFGYFTILIASSCLSFLAASSTVLLNIYSTPFPESADTSKYCSPYFSANYLPSHVFCRSALLPTITANASGASFINSVNHNSQDLRDASLVTSNTTNPTYAFV